MISDHADTLSLLDCGAIKLDFFFHAHRADTP
jgi:hypothetical protein